MTQSCSTRMVKGIHRFTLENYSLCRGIGEELFFNSTYFTVGGHQWAITVFPGVSSYDETLGDYADIHADVYFIICICLMSESDGVPLYIKMELLDQSGKGIHKTFNTTSPCIIATGERGFPCLIRRVELEHSPYLKDDCLKIKCTISIVLPSDTEIKSSSVAVPQRGDLGVDFLAMLKSGEGSDVILNVKGEKFCAHKVILSARSSVFARLLDSERQEFVIRNMEPRVMKALLHFIYSDTLAEDDNCLVDGYAFGPCVSKTFGAKLLAAADTWNLHRLKSICESHLWKSISLGCFVEILSLAGKHNASELKHLCFKYGVDNYGDLVESGSLSYLEKECPLLLSELYEYISEEGSLLHPNEMMEQGDSSEITTTNVPKSGRRV